MPLLSIVGCRTALLFFLEEIIACFLMKVKGYFGLVSVAFKVCFVFKACFVVAVVGVNFQVMFC